MPWNLGNAHWTLIVLRPKTREFEYYDSLVNVYGNSFVEVSEFSIPGFSNFQMVFKFLTSLAQDKSLFQNWTDKSPINQPKQCICSFYSRCLLSVLSNITIHVVGQFYEFVETHF